MRELRLLTLALAASLSFTACSSDETETGDSLSAGEFIERLYQTQMDKSAECAPAFSSYFMSTTLSGMAGDKTGLEASVAAGRLVFQADQANQCLKHLRAATCEDFLEDGIDPDQEACNLAFKPAVAPGGDCYGDECIDGTCANDNVCPGKCVADAKANESCANAVCGKGFYCDDSSRTCLARKAAGVACTDDTVCLDGLNCLEDGKCGVWTEPLAGAGESCESLSCARGLFCDEEATCTATKTAGAECESFDMESSECGDRLTCAGLTMDSSGMFKGKCTAWADIGGACTMPSDDSFVVSGCKIGLICQGGKCAAPPSSGPCANDLFMKCEPLSTYCDANSQCVAKKADGAACANSIECQSGDCISGKCDPGCRP